jgi:hypothetical protein
MEAAMPDDIDHRLEALTMNLEIASHDIRDLQNTVRELQSTVRELAATQHELAQAQRQGFADTMRIFEIVHDSIQGLENIAAAHQDRLDDLEKH